MTVARPRRFGRPLVATLLGLLVGASAMLPSAARAAEPSPGHATATIPADGSRAALAAEPFALNLASRSDFVAQTNFVQCVGASMQMMLNIVSEQDDRTARRQLQLQQLARRLSPARPDGRERQGASVTGWAGGLNHLGAGPYRLVGAITIDEAMRAAAAAIRDTGHPVGLLMWHGRHAWVMTGFRATADPARTMDFAVTAAVVVDPLYPHGSKTWGPSPKPGAALSIEALARQFVPRRFGSLANAWLAGFAGQYVLVLPYSPILVARVGRAVVS